MKIFITRQDNEHQYNSNGDAITDWNRKYCAWIIKPEYELADVRWPEKDFLILRGYTNAEYHALYPQCDLCPDIWVTWIFGRMGAEATFGEPHTFGQPYNYWDTISYPHSITRYWGYTNYSPSESVSSLGTYLGWHKRALCVSVKYNNIIIFKNKLNDPEINSDRTAAQKPEHCCVP